MTRELLYLVLAAAGGCSLARSPGISGGGARRYYLTKTTVPGNHAPGACARAFHMASRFELIDPALLAYDTALGLTTDDSGDGPPNAAATYDPPGATGWVRTGGASQYTDTAGAPGAAFANCAAWTTGSHDAFGTAAFLTERFGVPIWNGGSRRCDETLRVWCVEDRVSEPEPEERWRGRHRRHADDE